MASIEVCCIYCKKKVSKKGLNNHLNTIHFGKVNESILTRQEQLNNRIINYNKNPNQCKSCNKNLEYNKKNNKFCSKSCAASINNYKHSETSRKQQKLKVKSTYKQKEDEKNYCNVIFLLCKICSSPFYVTKWEEKRYTCSSNCLKHARIAGSIKGGKKSSQKRNIRSKDEKLLYNYCSTYFANLRHNEILIDGWDADIILDDHHIAILWNGPWHYKEMPFKNHSLKQVKQRDALKQEILTKNGWRVVIFDDQNWTPSKAFEWLVAEVGNAPTKDSL